LSAVPPEITELTGLTILNLGSDGIGDAGGHCWQGPAASPGSTTKRAK